MADEKLLGHLSRLGFLEFIGLAMALGDPGQEDLCLDLGHLCRTFESLVKILVKLLIVVHTYL